MPTFSPPVIPSKTTSRAHSPTTVDIRYGSGYSQRGIVGINQDRRTASVIWSTLTHADATTIEQFFEARLGYESFDYQLPTDSASRKWICKTWQRSEPDDLMSSITAELEQVFDP